MKTAAEVVRRHEQALHAQLHKEFMVDGAEGRVKVTLDIVPDEDDPHAVLAAFDAAGDCLAQWRVGASHKLSAAGARDWVEGGLLKPA